VGGKLHSCGTAKRVYTGQVIVNRSEVAHTLEKGRYPGTGVSRSAETRIELASAFDLMAVERGRECEEGKRPELKIGG